MAEIKELLPEEISELKSLSDQYSNLIRSLGELDIQIKELQDKKDSLEKEKSYLFSDYDSIKSKSDAITTKLVNKYGEGKINLETGKIELF